MVYKDNTQTGYSLQLLYQDGWELLPFLPLLHERQHESQSRSLIYVLHPGVAKCINYISQRNGNMWKQPLAQMESSVPVHYSFRRYHKYLYQLSDPRRPACYYHKSLQPLTATTTNTIK